MDALMNKIRNTYDFTEYELKIMLSQRSFMTSAS